MRLTSLDVGHLHYDYHEDDQEDLTTSCQKVDSDLRKDEKYFLILEFLVEECWAYAGVVLSAP